MPVGQWYYNKIILICLSIAILLATAWFTYKNHRYFFPKIPTSSTKAPTILPTTSSHLIKNRREYPFMAFLNIQHTDRSDNCGGTLIGKRHILTAAHCVQRASGVWIILGTDNIEEEEKSTVYLESKTFVIHENYNDSTHDNDIALIYLEHEVPINENINAISVFPRDNVTMNNRTCVVLGWGHIDSTQGLNDKLLKKFVTTIDNIWCLLVPESKSKPNDWYDYSKICAFGKRGPCHGDSGGPLLCGGVQVGIVSGRDKHCNLSAPTVYTDIAYYWQWIKNNIENDKIKNRREYPFMAYLYVQHADRSDNCGGTLIGKRHILTAAHCIRGALGVWIILGNDNIEEEEKSTVSLESKTFVIHENYNDSTHDNDIALIYLEHEVPINENINTVSLFSRDNVTMNYRSCVVLGWGHIDSTQGLNDKLLKKFVTTIDNIWCDLVPESTSKPNDWYDYSKICAFGKRGPCHGDSGGPLLCGGVQVGIVSGRDKHCNLSAPTVYTDIAYYWQWIKNNIENDKIKNRREYPFMAYLYVQHADRSDNCGGTLIGKRHILTAAHCIRGALGVWIILGNDNIEEEEKSTVSLESKTFVIHENYNDSTHDNDIALIYLEHEVPINENINTVSLFSRDNVTMNYRSCVVLGWGHIDSTQGLNDKLLKKFVTTIDNIWCDLVPESTSKPNDWYDYSKICAFGKRGPCHGDSGGPLLCGGVQVGIVSGGDKYCSSLLPTVFTDIGYYWQWIKNNTENDRW